MNTKHSERQEVYNIYRDDSTQEQKEKLQTAGMLVVETLRQTNAMRGVK